METFAPPVPRNRSTGRRWRQWHTAALTLWRLPITDRLRTKLRITSAIVDLEPCPSVRSIKLLRVSCVSVLSWQSRRHQAQCTAIQYLRARCVLVRTYPGPIYLIRRAAFTSRILWLTGEEGFLARPQWAAEGWGMGGQLAWLYPNARMRLATADSGRPVFQPSTTMARTRYHTVSAALAVARRPRHHPFDPAPEVHT